MLLCGEVVAIHVRTSTTFLPYEVKGIKESTSQYADDTQLLSKNSKESVQEIVSIFSTMEQNIGLKVNYEKTKIHLIGGSKQVETDRPFIWEEKILSC